MDFMRIFPSAKTSINSQEGFTFMEVLVAMLVALAFTLIAVQTIAISTVFKVNARRLSEATNWIREDLEQVRYQASNYYATNFTLTCTNSLTSEVTGYAGVFQANLGAQTITSRKLFNKPYVLTRSAQVYGVSFGSLAPYNTVKISYQIQPADPTNPAIAAPNSTVLSYLQSEVTPDESYFCPGKYSP
jgi:type II secretory pathway pseudopilin PulG